MKVVIAGDASITDEGFILYTTTQDESRLFQKVGKYCSPICHDKTVSMLLLLYNSLLISVSGFFGLCLGISLHF